MEALVIAINLILFCLIVISPIYLLIRLKRRNREGVFAKYILLGVLLLALLAIIFSWWGDESNAILLSHYGYDFEGWTEALRLRNVAGENLAKVKMLYQSSVGIGWPVKAIFAFVMLSPYLLVVYFGGAILDKMKAKP